MDGKYYTQYVLDSIRHRRLVCKNGVSLSVQTGISLYCTPRENNGPYESVEVGFVCDKDDNPIPMPGTWLEYADSAFPHSDSNTVLSDVYGYVPVELVAEFIEANGGLDTLAMLRSGFIAR